MWGGTELSHENAREIIVKLNVIPAVQVRLQRGLVALRFHNPVGDQVSKQIQHHDPFDEHGTLPVRVRGLEPQVQRH